MLEIKIHEGIGLHWKLPTERLHRVQRIGICLTFAGMLVHDASLWRNLWCLATRRTARKEFLIGAMLVLAGIVLASGSGWIQQLLKTLLS